jgi:hypothetical protein
VPVLQNARYEVFAQSIAGGKPPSDAFADAGFSPNTGNCSTLRNKPNVAARIDELLQCRQDVVLEKIAAEIEVTRETLLDELEEARLIAINAKNSSAAAQCSMGKARICGLIIDRREVGDAGAFDGHTDDQLTEEAAQRARSLGVGGPRLVEDEELKRGVG